MRIAALVLLIAAAPSAGGYPRFVVPDSPDVTVRTRAISRGQTLYTNTVQLKGARARMERTLDASGVRPDMLTHITQCDLRRTLVLNHAARLYGSFPIDDVPGRGDRLTALAAVTDEPVAEVITIDSVDTGERRALPPLTARHVITTTTTEMRAPARKVTTEVQDAWYVDLTTGCMDWGDAPATLLSVSSAGGVSGGGVRVKYLHRARIGYPVVVTTRAAWPALQVELLEVSDRPLDPALFDVPPGYQRGLSDWHGGYNPGRADTLFNRLSFAWEQVRALTARYWR